MIIRKSSDLRYSDITPKETYLNRRRFLASSAAALGAFAIPRRAGADTKLTTVKSPFSTTEKLTPLEIVGGYNNFYEFGTAKDEPRDKAKNFKTSPWSVSIEGLVAKPKTLDLDSIMKLAPLEER